MGRLSFARAIAPFAPVGKQTRGGGRSPASAPGRWLQTQRAEQRLSSRFDVLLYWFAYGEGRFDAGERDCLLAADPL